MNARTRKKHERRRRIWMTAGFLAFLALLCYDVIEINAIRSPGRFFVPAFGRSSAQFAIKADSVTASTATLTSSNDNSTDPPTFGRWPSATPAAAPEPSTLLLLAPALFLLTSRRHPAASSKQSV